MLQHGSGLWRPLQLSSACQKLLCLLCFNLLAAVRPFRAKVRRYPATCGPWCWGAQMSSSTGRQVLLLQVWAQSSPRPRATSVFSRYNSHWFEPNEEGVPRTWCWVPVQWCHTWGRYSNTQLSSQQERSPNPPPLPPRGHPGVEGVRAPYPLSVAGPEETIQIGWEMSEIMPFGAGQPVDSLPKPALELEQVDLNRLN